MLQRPGAVGGGAGPGGAARLETFSLLNGFVANLVRAELGTAADPEAAQAQGARLPELLSTGRYPRFAAALAEGGPPTTMDLTAHFERLLASSSADRLRMLPARRRPPSR